MSQHRPTPVEELSQSLREVSVALEKTYETMTQDKEVLGKIESLRESMDDLSKKINLRS